MSKLKRVLGLSGLTALVGAAAFAVPASASVKAECAFNGDAKTFDKDDPSIGVRQVDGQGKFVFDGLTIACVGDSNKDGIPEPPDVLDAVATGWYDNTVCGTGKALGTIDDITGADNPKSEAVLEGKKFGIQFVGTVGVFKWHDPTAKPPVNDPLKADPESEDKDNTGGEKDYTIAGTVQLGPPAGKVDPPDVAAGECTKAFSATGTVLVHFDS